MHWRLASTPVANVDHATGDIDGTLVSSGSGTQHPLRQLREVGHPPFEHELVASPGFEPVEARITRACSARFVRVADRDRAIGERSGQVR